MCYDRSRQCSLVCHERPPDLQLDCFNNVSTLSDISEFLYVLISASCNIKHYFRGEYNLRKACRIGWLNFAGNIVAKRRAMSRAFAIYNLSDKYSRV